MSLSPVTPDMPEAGSPLVPVDGQTEPVAGQKSALRAQMRRLRASFCSPAASLAVCQVLWEYIVAGSVAEGRRAGDGVPGLKSPVRQADSRGVPPTGLQPDFPDAFPNTFPDVLPDPAVLPESLRERLPVVAAFWPMGSEVDLRPLMEHLHAAGVPLALPVVVEPDCPLLFRQWQPGMELQDGPLHTRHPPAGAPTLSPDLLLVPLLAFDAAGYRLGYGGGFYDRTLENLRRHKSVRAIGVAFAEQQVEKIPRLPHDVPLEAVVTGRGVLSCHSS